MIFAGAAEALYRYTPPAPTTSPVYVLQAEANLDRVPEWQAKASGEFYNVVLEGGHYDVFHGRNLSRVQNTVERALGR
jgi:surfactin synthase thioesterase subunit